MHVRNGYTTLDTRGTPRRDGYNTTMWKRKIDSETLGHNALELSGNSMDIFTNF